MHNLNFPKNFTNKQMFYFKLNIKQGSGSYPKKKKRKENIFSFVKLTSSKVNHQTARIKTQDLERFNTRDVYTAEQAQIISQISRTRLQKP